MKSNHKRSRAAAILPPPLATASSDSDYTFTLTRIAVAQVCNSIGFTAAENPALQTLTDIATRYLRSIAKSAADSANTAGRTQSNLVDTVSAVDELSSVAGFPGAWRVTGTLLKSGALKELARFSNYSEEIPFAKPLPRNVFSTGKEDLRNVGVNEYIIGGKWKHIPNWLPIMPVIVKEERGEKGKELWEFCGENEKKMEKERGNQRIAAAGSLIVKKMEKKREGNELPMKRGKVRFKIGNGVLGVCKRRGKRVLCESWICDEQNLLNQKKSLR